MGIKPLARPLKSWEKAFKRIAENGDDRLLINDIFDDEIVTRTE